MRDTVNKARAADVPRSPEDLRQIKMFAGLDAPVLAAIAPLLTPRGLRARATLNMQTDLGGRVGFVWSGRHQVTAVSPAGASVTMFTALRGDAFGHTVAVLGYPNAHAMRLVSDQSGVILHMDGAALMNLAGRHDGVAAALVRTLAQQNADYGERIYELGALDVRARLQAALLRLAQNAVRLDGRVVVHPAPTQAALGAQIGAAREAVTRHLKDLAHEGVIAFSRGRIDILDLRRLQAMDTAASGRIWRQGDTPQPP